MRVRKAAPVKSKPGEQERPPAGRAPAGRSRMMRALACACLLSLALSLGAALEGCSGGGFSVNGVTVSRSGFEAEVARRLAVTRKKSPGELKGSRGDKLEAETERQVATEQLRAELMRQEAEKLGVKLPSDEVSRRFDAERARLGEEEFQKQLADQGLSESAYRKRLEEQALVDAIGSKVTQGITATSEEAESFYLTHKDLFGRTLMVHAADILLDTESQADMIAAEARRGRDFAELARMFSKDDASRALGGDLGWIERGTREPAFEEAAFSMKPGQVSGVVRASDGFHVIKVLDRREASVPPFEEVRGKALQMVTSNKKDEAFSDWLRSTYANARVTADGIGEWDPRLGMVVERE